MNTNQVPSLRSMLVAELKSSLHWVDATLVDEEHPVESLPLLGTQVTVPAECQLMVCVPGYHLRQRLSEPLDMELVRLPLKIQDACVTLKPHSNDAIEFKVNSARYLPMWVSGTIPTNQATWHGKAQGRVTMGVADTQDDLQFVESLETRRQLRQVDKKWPPRGCSDRRKYVRPLLCVTKRGQWVTIKDPNDPHILIRFRLPR
jgi:hypothetical protein